MIRAASTRRGAQTRGDATAFSPGRCTATTVLPDAGAHDFTCCRRAIETGLPRSRRSASVGEQCHDCPVDDVRDMEFDCVLFSRAIIGSMISIAS